MGSQGSASYGSAALGSSVGSSAASPDLVPRISGLARVSCQTWKFFGHNVAQAPVVGVVSGAPVLFCISRGASVQFSHRPGKGLAGPCFGPRHPGLATQRSRLRRGRHPNSALSPPPMLGDCAEPSVE
eukprot:7433985-Pyramimonas_sp.AAC.1